MISTIFSSSDDEGRGDVVDGVVRLELLLNKEFSKLSPIKGSLRGFSKLSFSWILPGTGLYCFLIRITSASGSDFESDINFAGINSYLPWGRTLVGRVM